MSAGRRVPATRGRPVQTEALTAPTAEQLGVGLPALQRLAATPRELGNSALDFPRVQRQAISHWGLATTDTTWPTGEALSQEVLAAYREAIEESEAAL